MVSHHYQTCNRCIMDSSDPDIVFDDQGNCNHCTAALKRMGEQLPTPAERATALRNLVETVSKEGKTNEYDCIIGVSGGVDSTTTAYWVKKLGLRPLAVHFDNGWNSELAVDNIHRTLEALQIDLHTHVVDWEEFRDLQLSFIKAGVPNCEAPTDHGIAATLFKAAVKYKVRFILTGSNLATESIMPHAWGHYNQDLKHIKAIHRRFGVLQLRTMPTISISDYLFNVLVRRIRQVPFLNYIAYEKELAKKMLAEEIGWRDYGGKHYESIWTRFFQGYYLPARFGFDKRKAHLSSLICSKQLTRDQALEQLARMNYPDDVLQLDLAFVLKKFGLSHAEFQQLMQTTPKRHDEYPGHFFLFGTLERYKNIFRRIATSTS